MPKAQKGKAAEKVVHPYSRKAAYLAREDIRLKRKERCENSEKLLWFQGQLDPEKTTYTRKDACDIIERYLQRFDSELEQIELMNGIKGRQGRLHGAREAVIKQTIERERAQYEGIGFGECSSYKSTHKYTGWTGDLKKLPNIKLRKVSNRGLDTKSEEKEETHEAEDKHEDDEDDLDEEELDDLLTD
uniref:Translation machinery-associated protein 16 n=1 Tax=Mola mola TaxID=94237 RepID=A0A3Q3W5C2_MOLML